EAQIQNPSPRILQPRGITPLPPSSGPAYRAPQVNSPAVSVPPSRSFQSPSAGGPSISPGPRGGGNVTPSAPARIQPRSVQPAAQSAAPSRENGRGRLDIGR